MKMKLKTLTVLTVGVALGGCSMFWHTRKTDEQIQRGMSGSQFQAIVVIAGNDARYDLRMSAMVREQLTDAGITALRRSGRWGSESDAIADICPAGQAATVDGVLFVYYNQLTLIDCRTHARAYEITGGDLGLPGMAKRLIAYLQGSARDSKQGDSRQ